MLTILSVAYPFALVGIDPVGGAEQIMSLVERAIHVAGHRSGLARNGAGAQSANGIGVVDFLRGSEPYKRA
jgi:hypothetical protein